MNRYLILFIAFIIISAFFLSCGNNKRKKRNGENSHIFSYCNPNSRLKLTDTQIIWGDSVFYAVGTSAPYWRGDNPGVKLYRSRDLKEWEFVKLLIDAEALDKDVWYRHRFWAPEIHRLNNRFYLTFNCRNDGGVYNDGYESKKHYHACGISVSDNIEGPYTVKTHDEPLTSFASNDLTLFQDDDGKIYCFFNNGWTNDPLSIYAAELDTVTFRLKTEPVVLISQEPGTWDSAGIEGAYVIKRDSLYYLFYSSWTHEYAVGYATSDNVSGPWVKYEKNPILGAFVSHDTTYVFNDGEIIPKLNSPYTAVGHNELFMGPDGILWISCHANTVGNEHVSLVIDPIWFEDGHIKTNALTFTPQKVKINPEILLRFPGLSK